MHASYSTAVYPDIKVVAITIAVASWWRPGYRGSEWLMGRAPAAHSSKAFLLRVP